MVVRIDESRHHHAAFEIDNRGGVASDRCIATGIAEAMSREGANLAFTYQVDKLKKRVDKLAQACGSDIVLPLDVTSDDQIADVFTELGKQWNGLDGIVHSVGFAPRDQLEGSYADAVTREGFAIAHDMRETLSPSAVCVIISDCSWAAAWWELSWERGRALLFFL